MFDVVRGHRGGQVGGLATGVASRGDRHPESSFVVLEDCRR
jgi:hypothetical protein